jgi:hypothetical protein
MLVRNEKLGLTAAGVYAGKKVMTMSSWAKRAFVDVLTASDQATGWGLGGLAKEFVSVNFIAKVAIFEVSFYAGYMIAACDAVQLW